MDWRNRGKIKKLSLRWQMLALFVLGGVLLGTNALGHAKAATTFPVFSDDVLSTFTFKEFNVLQPNSPYLKIVPVTGQSFTSALQITTPPDIKLPKDDSAPYAVTTAAPTAHAIAKGDTLEATFWLQQVSVPAGQESQTTFAIERIGGDYAKSILRTLYPTPDWKQYHYLFKSADDFAAGTAQISFWLGYNPGQVLALGGLTVNDLGPDVPVPPPTYEGRDPNAPWRAEAAKRIEQYRKGNFNISVKDLAGNPINNADVHVKMLNHDFRFGTAVDASMIVGDNTSSDAQIYREKITQLFNQAVMGNDLKWPEWEDINWRETHTLPAIKWLRANGLTVRGHNLIWYTPWASPPADVLSLTNDPQALSNRIDNHIRNEVGTLRGQIRDWDVVNELGGGHTLSDILGGNSALVHWFQVAQQADPKAQYTLNDDPFFAIDGGPNKTRMQFYGDIIKYMKAHGGPISRLGIESHFSPDQLPSPEQTVTLLDQVAALGVTPEITEFDLSTTDNQLQADYTRDYLTAVFSNPHTDTFMMWGFWNGDVWQPNTGLFDNDWSLKPNGKAWQDLVYNQWWTDVTGKTNQSGKYSTRGFLGDYQIDVTVNGKINTVYTSLAKGGKNLVVRFDPQATPPAPVAKPLPAPAPGAAPFVPDRGGQLLSNGNIEGGTGNWYCFGGCPLSQDKAVVHGGGSSLHVSGRTAFWQGPAQNITSGVKNGETYQSDVWVRLATGSAPTTVTANIKVQTDASADAVVFPVGSATATADGWTEIKGSAQLKWTGKATTAEWWLSTPYDAPATDLYVDDAQITSPLAPRTVVARNFTSLNGRIDGSLQQLTPSNVVFNAGSEITRGLYVPGTPLLEPNGRIVVSSEFPAGGTIAPSDKKITLNPGSNNKYLISRTDPDTLTPVQAPAIPQGTRDVTINRKGQNVGDFSTLRNLTLNAGTGEVVVPAGTYSNFTANASTILTFGTAGATTPTVYNLQSLTLNAGSKLNIVGPVTINLAHGPQISGRAGSEPNPLWLTLNVAEGDVTLNSGAVVHGVINVPAGKVTVNAGAVLHGRVSADSININAGGLVRDASIASQ